MWQGCRRIGEDEVFLMNGAVPDSFDGRYFGPISTTAIIGKAHLLWTQTVEGNQTAKPVSDIPITTPTSTKEYRP